MRKEKNPKTITRGGKEIIVFDTPAIQLLCEKCGTTNYFYEDDKKSYHCDTCDT